MFRKFIITVICCLSIFALCAVPSFAATMSDKEMAIEQISLCWQTSTSKKNVVSFDSLTSLCAELNRAGYPCEIAFVSSLNGYAIKGTGYVHNTYESSRVYSLSGKYYSNIEGSIFYSPYQSDSLLSGISTYVSSISSTLTTKLTTLTNGVASIYTKLTSIDDTVLIGTGTLNNIYNHLTGDLTTYLQSIDSSVSGSETFLGQINSKLDTIISKMTTGSGVTDFSSITSRLDSILASMGSPEVKSNFPVWRLNNDSISDLTVSDVGYDALSSLCATVTSDYLNYQVTDGSAYFYLDTINSLDLVHTTVGGHTGYFIQVDGTYRQSVDGVNQFFDGILYLSERNGTLFYASDASRASAGASVSLSSDALYTNFGTIGQLAQAYQGGTLDPSTTFPTLNAVVVGLLGLAQKIDAVDLNPKVEVVVKEAEYTVNHFTDVVVDSSNDIYNVFYLTDEDGNQTSVGRVAADSLGASGKLLQFLFKFCVDGALSGVDGSMDSLNDFYFDNAESSLGEGVSIWD